MAKICIVLATYNGEKYLSQMLDSLVAQTRPADMIIAVDDGSKDSSAQILESYAQKLPLQIHVSPQNQGHRAAFSKALEIARTNMGPDDLIALADQDDIWLPHKLSILENEIDAVHSLIFGDAQVIDGEGKIIAESWRTKSNINLNTTIKHQIAGINHVTGCLCMFKAKLLYTILPIPEGVTVHDRWIAMIAERNGGIKAIPERVVQYRIHGANAVGGKSSSSMSNTLKLQEIWATTILENLTLLKLTDSEISFTQRLLSITKQRMNQNLVLDEIFWIFMNRKYLFLEAPQLTIAKRILFSVVGLPLAKKLWGKE